MNDQQKVQLLPCPFCGGEAEMVEAHDDDGRFAAVGCNKCGAGSRQHYFCGDDARDYAASAWNTRRAAIYPAGRAGVEECLVVVPGAAIYQMRQDSSCLWAEVSKRFFDMPEYANWQHRILYTNPIPSAEQAALAHASSASAEECSVVGASFQSRVAEWMSQCFIPSLYSNMTERGDRLLEEVLELLQAHGYDQNRVTTLVEYVFGRPVGEPTQEVGGVMVTLAGYCWIAGLDMRAAGGTELARICQPEVMAKIRAKQEAKNALHFDTPLPGNAIDQAIAVRRGDGNG